MKKAFGVLALLAFVFLVGTGYAEAADMSKSYARTLRYEYNGQELSSGAVLQIEAGQVYNITVYGSNYVETTYDLRPGLYDSASISVDQEALVETPTENSLSTEFVPNLNRVVEADPIGSIRVLSATPETVSVRYIIRWNVLDDWNEPLGYVYANEPFRLWVVSNSPVQYLQPKNITIRDENGYEVNGIIPMTGGETRTFYIEVDDYLNDGIMENDFNYVSGATGLTYETTTTDDVLNTNDSPPLGLIYNEGGNMPRRLSPLRITALNQGDDEEGNYNDMYGTVSWALIYEFGDAEQTVRTQTISVLVTARDDAGGDYDDAGGSCNAIGLGAMALLFPLTFLRKRK